MAEAPAKSVNWQMKVSSLPILSQDTFLKLSENLTMLQVTVCVFGLPSSVMTAFTTALGHHVFTALNMTLNAFPSSWLEIAQAIRIPAKYNKSIIRVQCYANLVLVVYCNMFEVQVHKIKHSCRDF